MKKAPKLLNGDLVIENGELVMISDDEELVQSVQAILGTRKGEFFLDSEHGLSHENVLGKPANQDLARDDIIEALMQEERVASILAVNFDDDKAKRKRNVSLTIEKSNGSQLPIDGGDFDVG
jgi:phage baseplate assembly protein W